MKWIATEVEGSVVDALNPQIKQAMRSSVKDSLYTIRDKWRQQVKTSPLVKEMGMSFPITVTYPSDSEGTAGVIEMKVVLPNTPTTTPVPFANVPSPADFIQSTGKSWNLLMGSQPNGITPLGISQANKKLNRAARRKQAKNPGLQRIVNSYQPKKKQPYDPVKWMSKAIQNVQDVENMSKYAQSTMVSNLMTQLNGIA